MSMNNSNIFSQAVIPIVYVMCIRYQGTGADSDNSRTLSVSRYNGVGRRGKQSIDKMIRELPPVLAKIAAEELNEKPGRTKDDVQHLKEWIAKQPHLKARTNDQWLVAMLRGCKFSLEKAKHKLDLYYTLKTTAADVTLRLKPSSEAFIDFFRVGTVVVLPKPKDKLFPRVILIRPGAYDPEVYSVADLMCVFYYLVQILIVEDDLASVMGTKVMVDYTGTTMNHLVQASPSMIKKMMAVSQDSMPLRLKGSHHVNLPLGIDKIFSLISGFLNEKGRERLKIHKNCNELPEFIPKEIIPKEYGGSGDTIENSIEHWVSKLKEYNTWMKEEEQLGTDESKRVGTSPFNQDLGMDGSFRKLNLD